MQPELISVSVAVTNNNSLYFSLDMMLGNNRTTLSITCTSTHSYTWTERGTVTVHVKCGAQHKAIQDPSQGSNLNPSGLKPGLFDSESSALTIRPMCPWGLKWVPYYLLARCWEIDVVTLLLKLSH